MVPKLDQTRRSSRSKSAVRGKAVGKRTLIAEESLVLAWIWHQNPSQTDTQWFAHMGRGEFGRRFKSKSTEIAEIVPTKQLPL